MSSVIWSVNKPLKLRIQAESSGLNIAYKIFSPLGLFEEGTATDEGDGVYSIQFTPNETGIWFVEWIFPDGFKIHHHVVVDTFNASINDKIDLIRKFLMNRWKIDNYELIIFDDDGITPLKKYKLYDKLGQPTETNVFDRVPE